MGRRQTVSLTLVRGHPCPILSFCRELQDNFTVEWDPHVISDVLRSYVLEHHITTVRARIIRPLCLC